VLPITMSVPSSDGMCGALAPAVVTVDIFALYRATADVDEECVLGCFTWRSTEHTSAPCARVEAHAPLTPRTAKVKQFREAVAAVDDAIAAAAAAAQRNGGSDAAIRGRLQRIALPALTTSARDHFDGAELDAMTLAVRSCAVDVQLLSYHLAVQGLVAWRARRMRRASARHWGRSFRRRGRARSGKQRPRTSNGRATSGWPCGACKTPSLRTVPRAP
jgi:hypothetical protein